MRGGARRTLGGDHADLVGVRVCQEARALAVLKKVNDNKNHIPPLTTKEALPFPWELVLVSAPAAPEAAASPSGLFGGMLDMLKAGASPLATSPPANP